MKTVSLGREVARIDRPQVQRGMAPAHRLRPLIEPGNWAATDPFLLMMEDWVAQGVFDRHPHRGIETVTYMVDGVVEHYDNHGNQGHIGPGDVGWLTAGRGLVHNEQPADGTTVHVLQLWVNLPAADKLTPARFQNLKAAQMPVRREAGAELRVFSGASGPAVAATLNHAPVTMVDVRLEPGARVEQEVPADYNGFVLVLEGSATVGASATQVEAGQVAWLTHEKQASQVVLQGGAQGAHVLLIAGQPLREPVAARGPFVMNTAEELMTAFTEFQLAGDEFGR